jgi:superfamily II DNA helicase RecQ
VPILALTATASPKVQADVESILRIEGCEVFRTSFDRPNLLYEV